jgi:hypothetical protein
MKRLAKVPTVDIKLTINATLNDITLTLKVNRQIPISQVQIDESNIIIAIDRGESPRSAS